MAGKIISVLLSTVFTVSLHAQDILSMQQALDLGVRNYGTVVSKTFQAEASQYTLSQSKRDYLPNVVLSAQQVYGTVNGQNGPLYGFGGVAVASSGLPLKEQNWNAAFGSLYLANINWEVFTFGRAKGRIEVARESMHVAESDLTQERFQHQVRVAAAYLNVLASQRLTLAQQENLQRTEVIRKSIVARAKNGLVAGVDSALANAEVASAKIALIRAVDIQKEQERNLALLTGLSQSSLSLDSTFVFKTPNVVQEDTIVLKSHPVLNFYESRVRQSESQLRLSKKSYFPSLNFVSVFQMRGSGFASTYAQDQTAFRQSYIEGMKPTRSNYLVGIGLIWNLTTIARTQVQAKALGYLNMAARAELQLAKEQVNTQAQIADTKLTNALFIQQEAPIQVRSATDAYTQKSTLYRNGLTTLVEVTQTLYTLNRAETDRDLAFINVWQALLLKAAAAGDLSLFTNELNR